MYPSGSNITISQNMGNISLNDLQEGRTRANIYANEVQLGVYRGDIVLIGNTGSLVVVKGTTHHTGSIDVDGSVTASVFSGSFVGDGSGLTGIAGSINTGSFATTGSNTFRGTETISGSVLVSGSVNADGFELDGSTTTTIPALNSTFNLDLSGSGDFGGINFINKSLVLNDGKVLIAGRFQSIDGHTTNDIARLNSNGTVDTSFTAPIFEDVFGGGDYYGYINTFATQSDNKIVVGGNFYEVSGSAREGIARLNTDGTLDTSFAVQSWGSFGEVRDIAIQNDGKIVCVGYFTSGSRRINTDGTLDTSFNVSTGSNNPSFFNTDNFYSVALLDSGSEQAILIGGNFQQWGSFSDYNYLVKLNPNGSLDFGFAGTNLDMASTSNGFDRIQKIKVSDDGYIYVAGRFRDTLTGPNVRNAGFARLTTTDEGNGIGAFDSGFRTYITGSDQNNPGTQYVNDFDFYDGDKILLGGSFTTIGIPGYTLQSANRFVIVRQSTGGQVSNWSSDGLASKYNLNNNFNTATVNSVTLLSGDNVLVGGTFTSASFPQTAREGLASLKLTGFGDVTTTSEYTITADSTRLLVSSSNTRFSGDVNIVGNVTASIQEGYVLVGGAGDVSKLAATSSFGGGSSTDISALNTFTESADGRLDNLELSTGSFATTGSNTFVGTQQITGSILVSGSINSDGYELEGSSTTAIPTLNDSFNLDLVPSGSTTTFINKSLVLGDGKILVAGRFQSIDGHTTNDIARLNSDGTIDTSFAAPMFSGSNFSGGDTAGWVNTFATQSDGKIVVGGNFIRVGEGVDARRGIARLNTDGTLDTSFVTQSFDSFASSNGVRDLVIQDDGKIIFVGTFTSGSRRVNTDGTLDTTFDISQGNNQPLAFNNGDFHSVALIYGSGSEQDVLIGGRFGSWGSSGDYNHLVKLFPNGRLDFGFAGANLDIIWSSDGYNAGDRIEKIKVDSDNNIYIAGRFKDTGIGNHAGFARVLPTDDRGDGRGALDNGFRTYISGSYVEDFDFYDGDKILLGGSFTTFGNPSFSTTSANRFAIIDQNDGGLVTNWLTDTLSAKYNLNTGTVNSVTLLSGDNVLVGGTFTQANSTAREGLASLKLTGFGDVTTTSEYTITADSTRLLVSSSTTQFSGDVNIIGNVTASVISGSFVGDGSELTGLPTINTGSFATTGSNTFVGNQTITGSVGMSGSVVITGSFDISGSVVITGSFDISGSISQRLQIGTNNIVLTNSPLANLSNNNSDNTVIGASAGTSLTGANVNNTFVGSNTGVNNIANSNTFVGAFAGKVNTTGNDNTFVGMTAGFDNTTGVQNTFIGSDAGSDVVSGSDNTFIGYSAGSDVVDGNYSVYVGSYAGNRNISGDHNTGVGYFAGFSNIVGQRNTLLGTEAGYVATSGDDNLMLGYRAGAFTNAGQNLLNSNTSVFLGSNARGLDNATNQIVIGALAQGNGSNTTTIGTSSTTATYLRGKLVLSGSIAQEVTGSLRVSGNEIITGSLSVTGSLNVSGSVNVDGSGFIILSQLSASQEYADDFDAAAGGVPLGALYRNGGFVRIRIT
jgi:uncharacterized delta-60 repeat protein